MFCVNKYDYMHTFVCVRLNAVTPHIRLSDSDLYIYIYIYTYILCVILIIVFPVRNTTFPPHLTDAGILVYDNSAGNDILLSSGDKRTAHVAQ